MTAATESAELMDDQPSPRARLAWWFGIYFAAQLPLVFLLPWNPRFPLFFPIGLGLPFNIGQIDYVKVWYPDRFTVFFLCYVLYFAHLAFTYYAPTHRTFKRLIISLTIIVLFTLFGSYMELSRDLLFDRNSFIDISASARPIDPCEP